MDRPKIERLLKIIMMMTSRNVYTIEDMASRLSTSTRSVYRYIETLRASGFVIEKRSSSTYRLAKLPNSSLDLSKLVYFSEEEAYIINRLIYSLDSTNVLKANLLKKLSAILSMANITDVICNGKYGENVEKLGTAIRDRRRVTLKSYESAHSKSIADRHVEPFAFTTNFIDIWAYDIDKQENRIFKVARIGEVNISEEEWKFQDAHRKASSDCFRMNGSDRYHVKLELSLMAKNLLIEEYPLAEKDLKCEDGKWILDTIVNNLAGVGRFVIGLAAEINITESPELEEYIREYVSQYLA